MGIKRFVGQRSERGPTIGVEVKGRIRLTSLVPVVPRNVSSVPLYAMTQQPTVLLLLRSDIKGVIVIHRHRTCTQESKVPCFDGVGSPNEEFGE